MTALRLLTIVVIVVLSGGVFFTSAEAQDDVVPINCGDIVEAETGEEQPIIDFQVQSPAGTIVNGRIEPIGPVNIAAGFYDSSDEIFASFSETGAGDPEIINVTLATSNPTLSVGIIYADGIGYEIRGWQNGFGAFTIYLGCTLRDGTVINPGDSALESTTEDESATTTTSQSESQNIFEVDFSGFGFPGVNPVDFSAGIEIPLTLGQPQTAPLASDVALYTYEASGGATATLSIGRVSGDISIGVTVIKRESNEIIFMGGLPSSNNLTVELTFPSDGVYAIGLFRLDTVERSGTSGAVQITLQ